MFERCYNLIGRGNKKQQQNNNTLAKPADDLENVQAATLFYDSRPCQESFYRIVRSETTVRKYLKTYMVLEPDGDRTW